MINTEQWENKTQAGQDLTAEDIKVIAISREGASPEVNNLLEIIDRLTETKWVLS